jgi:DNA polymerase I-like protein with 3'-5' exonuclease and polymerase domains
VWKMPESFPDLSRAKKIAVDCETCDPTLKTKGPGVRRGGYIVGVAVGTDDGFRGYYPVRHEGSSNLDPKSVMRWLRTELGRDQIKVGANLMYDADFLASENVVLNGRWMDVQVAEPLLDENLFSYSLNSLAKRHLGETKEEDEIERYAKNRGWKGKAQEHIWRMPANVVGPYAEVDVDLPLRILEKQIPKLQEEELWDLFEMESKLTKVLLRMRRLGVRIDVAKLEEVIGTTGKRIKQLHEDLRKEAGQEVQIWAAESVGKAFDRLGLTYPTTPKTKKPSFTHDFLERHEHSVPRKIVELRTLEKFRGTFLVGSIQNMLVGDRIHCLFHQLKGDDYGTVTGRLSSSQPNLQFIPARDKILGPLVRSMFVPEDGCLWGKADMSQIEFRLFSHYASGPGSDEVRTKYNEDPKVDFHQMCADMAHKDRKKAKTINFGKIYGMGVDKLCASMGMSRKEAETFMQEYDEAIPFVKYMLTLAASVADRRGYVRTILGRRRRFNLWEPADWVLSKKVPPKSKEETIQIVREALSKDPGVRPGVRRAKTYKALNAIIQGSAADQIKKAMVDCDEAGLWNVLPLHLTVHDELDVSIPNTTEGKEAFQNMVRTMEKAVPLKVPVLADTSIGKNWGEC